MSLHSMLVVFAVSVTVMGSIPYGSMNRFHFFDLVTRQSSALGFASQYAKSWILNRMSGKEFFNIILGCLFVSLSSLCYARSISTIMSILLNIVPFKSWLTLIRLIKLIMSYSYNFQNTQSHYINCLLFMIDRSIKIKVGVHQQVPIQISQ